MSEMWTCPCGATFSGTPDFISGARSAHEIHGDQDLRRGYIRWLLDRDPEFAAKLVARGGSREEKKT